jgi:hypothetical protein
MPKLAGHPHAFADWPFVESVNSAAFTTSRVLEEGFPILMVSHEDDGDWQFLCGTTSDYEHCKLICLGCALESDGTLATIADLPRGWLAFREFVGGPWDRQPHPEDDD